jgi:hypothetical protein
VVAARSSEQRAPRVLVSVAAIAVAAVDALYLALINSQGGPPPDSVIVTPFVASYLGLMALLLAVSLVTPHAIKAGLRGAAAGGLVAMALLTGFSIGVAVLVPAALGIAAEVVTLADGPTRRATVAAIAGAIVSVAVLAGGLQIAWSYISCPPTGESGGTTASFFGPGASYQCVNGVLTVAR